MLIVIFRVTLAAAVNWPPFINVFLAESNRALVIIVEKVSVYILWGHSCENQPTQRCFLHFQTVHQGWVVLELMTELAPFWIVHDVGADVEAKINNKKKSWRQGVIQLTVNLPRLSPW